MFSLLGINQAQNLFLLFNSRLPMVAWYWLARARQTD